MKTELEKMLEGENYYAFADELCVMRDRTINATLKFNTTGDKSYIEQIFLKKYENLTVNPPFHCDYGENVKIGKNAFINFNCTILSCAEVEIGDNCYIGPNVQIYTALHPLSPEERNQAINFAKPVKIGANCWIGGGVTILPGVEIGEGSTIGAGSVVTKSIPSRMLAYGNPCKVIKNI